MQSPLHWRNTSISAGRSLLADRISRVSSKALPPLLMREQRLMFVLMRHDDSTNETPNICSFFQQEASQPILKNQGIFSEEETCRQGWEPARHHLIFWRGLPTGALYSTSIVFIGGKETSKIPRFVPTSVGRASGFVRKLYAMYRKIDFSAERKTLEGLLKVPTNCFAAKVSLVTSLFGENHGLPTFRVV